MTVLFSGRFCPPHPGHFATIIRLAEKFGAVKVVMLDYKERDFSVDECLEAFNETFRVIPLDVTFHVNKTHFAKITRSEIDEFRPFDIYCAAENFEVLEHIASIGIQTYSMKRSLFYSARYYKPD